jgi:dienelactone hydrolase
MSITLVSDVFGLTSALIKLAEALKVDTIVDPYDGVDMTFNNEAEAYSYFMDHIGLDVYLAKLIKAIQPAPAATNLIGFSVGACVVWRLSEKVSSNVVKRGFCFYGAQIRHYSELNPRFEIELIFPESEPHFDVSELQANLAKKQNVKTVRANCLHGFMNSLSRHYNQLACQDQIDRLSVALEP